MNTVGVSLLWCGFQVTVLSLLAIGVYLLVRRLGPSVRAVVVLTSLGLVVVL